MSSVELPESKILRHSLAEARHRLEQAVGERASHRAVGTLRSRVVVILDRLDRLHAIERLRK